MMLHAFTIWSLFSCHNWLKLPSNIADLLQETLHKPHRKERSCFDSFDSLETAHFPTDENESTEKTEGDPKPKKSLFKNWPLMSSIIVYCLFSLQDMAYTEVFLISHLALRNATFFGL